ncbi:MAG TPA: DUF933 domain-containing protein, partial [Thermoanaerobaculia bacterium]|nr:DUF933 domain-containing protein [Thermoanaerobaculia bacterium]
KEVRAWTIPAGETAARPAGRIHTDFEKAFIRAETIGWRDLLDAGSWHAARDHGRIRSEGRDHPLADGDVVLFRFHD